MLTAMLNSQQRAPNTVAAKTHQNATVLYHYSRTNPIIIICDKLDITVKFIGDCLFVASPQDLKKGGIGCCFS